MVEYISIVVDKFESRLYELLVLLLTNILYIYILLILFFNFT